MELAGAVVLTAGMWTVGWLGWHELRPVAIPTPSAEAVQFHQTGNWLWAVGQLWALAVPAAFLFSGLSARLRAVASRRARS